MTHFQCRFILKKRALFKKVRSNSRSVDASDRSILNCLYMSCVLRGARWFSEHQGLEVVDSAEDDKAMHETWHQEQQARGGSAHMSAERDRGGFGGPEQHDTVALLAIDANGDIAGGCSTSGWCDL